MDPSYPACEPAGWTELEAMLTHSLRTLLAPRSEVALACRRLDRGREWFRSEVENGRAPARERGLLETMTTLRRK